MTATLRDLLHRSAAAPERPLDLDRLRARGRRARQVAAAAACSLLVGVITMAVVLVPRALDHPRPDQPAGPLLLGELPVGWSQLPAPPQVRHRAATAWTGRQLLMWGGTVPGYSSVAEDSGYRYDTRTGRWHAMAPSPLAPRVDPGVAWTGQELLVWGGTTTTTSPAGRRYGDGAAYDPERDVWRRLPPAPLNARAPLSVWTGEELIVWGTTHRGPDLPADGAAYHPATDSWRTISDGPVALTDATAVWTGQEMIVFGAALDRSTNTPTTATAVGAAYNPVSDTWRRLPDSTLSPQASTAAWNGRLMIAADYQGAAAGYDPAADRWRRLPDLPRDPGECRPDSAAVERLVLVHACRAVAVYDPVDDRWHDVTHQATAGWWAEAVPAGGTVILLARDVRSGNEAVLVHRPAG